MSRVPRVLAVVVGVSLVGVGSLTPAAFGEDAPAGAAVAYVPEPTPALASLVPAGTDPRIVTVLWYALDAVGLPYAFGARGPVAYDCSGLVDAAYRSAGLRVGPTTTQQRTAGVAVTDTALLAPGDLLFVPGADGTADDPGHVGIYLGGGLIVQATHTGDVVRITPLAAWSGQLATVRRIVTAPDPGSDPSPTSPAPTAVPPQHRTA